MLSSAQNISGPEMARRPKPDGLLHIRPELSEDATLLLEALAWGAEVFEFGSGGSTLWFARLATRLVSIEDDAEWYKAIAAALLTRTGECCVHLRKVETAQLPDAIDGTGLWDLVFVDCLTQNERRRSVILGAKHVKPGGWLVADDYNFPMTHKAVEGLRTAGWDVGIVSGIKTHPIRKVAVKTSTAFCHRPGG